MDTYNSIFNNYANYTTINLPSNKCYTDRNIEIVSSNKNINKCIDIDTEINKQLNNRFNNNINQNNNSDENDKIDNCKNIFLNSNIKNSSTSNINLYNNKSNKILTKRILNTIPYRNYTNYIYNPELEIFIKNSNFNGNKKSVNNTSEIKTSKYPLQKNIKSHISNKNNYIDLDRFNLSTRQIKGNDYYINNYKKQLNNISTNLN